LPAASLITAPNFVAYLAFGRSFGSSPVSHNGLEITSRAGIQMASERSRSACGDGPQHAELLVAKPGAVLFSKAVTLDAKDIGHLHGRPTHFSFFR
jgi:hypothetical protein